MTTSTDREIDSMCASLRKLIDIDSCMPSLVIDMLLQLKAERTRFIKDVVALNSLRPHWAMGYTSDSAAAQCSSAALSQVWEVLGVDNQTDAMRNLLASRPKPGYVVVPVEPTKRMLDASNELPDVFSVGDEWKAMIKAAAPSTGQGE